MKRSILSTLFSGILAVTMGIPVAAAQAGVSAPSENVPATTAKATAPGKVFKVRFFQTPSRNIRCAGVRDGRKYSMRCDIYEHYWTAPGPNTCTEGDYGSSVGMRGRSGWPDFLCVSDAVDPGRVVPYGSYWYMGPMTCLSKSTGLTCWNAGRHGWFLSRESYELF